MGNKQGKDKKKIDPNELSLRIFKLEGVLGKGAFGKVRLVEHKITKEKFALKYVSKRKCIETKSTRNIFRERVLMQDISHPFIINLKYAFQDDENLFFVIDYAPGGDLRFHLDRMGKVDDLTLQIYIAELALAIRYLHSQYIIHRDLKPENLLLDAQGHIHITDFNIAVTVRENLPKNQSGTRKYLAPEMYYGKPYGCCVDWWALGIIMYECTFGYRPFGVDTVHDMNEKTTDKMIGKLIRHANVEFPTKLKRYDLQPFPGRNEFIDGLLKKKYEERIGYGVAPFDPKILASHNCLETQIKVHEYFNGLDWKKLEKRELIPPFIPETTQLNVGAAVVLDELFVDDDHLNYKPRKNKTKSVTKSQTTSGKKATQKEKVQAEMDFLDREFLDFAYNLPHLPRMNLKDLQKKPGELKLLGELDFGSKDCLTMPELYEGSLSKPRASVGDISTTHSVRDQRPSDMETPKVSEQS